MSRDVVFPISFINSAQTPYTQNDAQNIPLPQLNMSSPSVIKQLKISQHSTPPSKESNMEPQYSIPRHSSSLTPVLLSTPIYSTIYRVLNPRYCAAEAFKSLVGRPETVTASYDFCQNVQQGRERGKYHNSSGKRKSLQRINMCTSRTPRRFLGLCLCRHPCLYVALDSSALDQVFPIVWEKKSILT